MCGTVSTWYICTCTSGNCASPPGFHRAPDLCNDAQWRPDKTPCEGWKEGPHRDTAFFKDARLQLPRMCPGRVTELWANDPMTAARRRIAFNQAPGRSSHLALEAAQQLSARFQSSWPQGQLDLQRAIRETLQYADHELGPENREGLNAIRDDPYYFAFRFLDDDYDGDYDDDYDDEDVDVGEDNDDEDYHGDDGDDEEDHEDDEYEEEDDDDFLDDSEDDGPDSVS